MNQNAASSNVLDRWLSFCETNVDRHVLLICVEKQCSRDDVIDELRNIVRVHYVAPEITAKRLLQLGAPRTAELLREHLPTSRTAQSGDLGEVLAIEFTERRLAFRVPVRRLRWKDERNMALRGDDIVAIAWDSEGRLMFLKGESKSRTKLTSSVVADAASALDRDLGRPTRHSVLFVAERLRERGEEGLAGDLEKALYLSFEGYEVVHLLFALSGNNPTTFLSDHLDECTSQRCRHAVGLHIADHGEFVGNLFSGL